MDRRASQRPGHWDIVLGVAGSETSKTSSTVEKAGKLVRVPESKNHGISRTQAQNDCADASARACASKNARCEICGQDFEGGVSSKNKHMRGVHFGMRPFKCNYPSCSSSFQYKKPLDNHINTVHKKMKPYECRYCNKKFGDPSNCRKHELRKHRNVQEQQASRESKRF